MGDGMDGIGQQYVSKQAYQAQNNICVTLT